MRTYVRRGNGVAVPGDTEHAVAAGLDHEFMLSRLDDVSRNDIFDATVTTVAPGNALERGAVGRVDHGFAARIKLDYMREVTTEREERRRASSCTHIARGRIVPSSWES